MKVIKQLCAPAKLAGMTFLPGHDLLHIPFIGTVARHNSERTVSVYNNEVAGKVSAPVMRYEQFEGMIRHNEDCARGMLDSVTERTREMDLSKALGARNSDILSQFLIEAVTLCLIGGALGIALGFGLGWAAYFFIKVQPALGFGTVFPPSGFSTVIGVGFGFWPARRAAMLAQIEALRYE